MKATVSWMYIKPHRNQLPHVEIIEGEEEIVNYITRLHAFVDAIVEYQGFCYYLSDKAQRIQITQLVSQKPTVKEVIE